MRPLSGAHLGLGWRPETARLIETTARSQTPLGFVEVIAESVMRPTLPPALVHLMRAGVPVVPHGVGLGLGSALPPERKRLAALARVCRALDAPFVSEHIAFVRAAGIETGHLLPIPRTRAALAILCDNVRRAQDALPVLLVLENIAELFTWPDDDLQEGERLAELVHRTGVGLLLDVANLHANVVNHGVDLSRFLRTLPCEAIVYVHVAGGIERAGFYCDTHAHPVSPAVLATLATVLAHIGPRPVLLERDEGFDSRAELVAELAAIARVLAAAPELEPAALPSRPDHAPPVAAAARRALAAQQAALVRAVMAAGPIPEGHDPLALERTRATLLAKQRRLADRCPRSHAKRSWLAPFVRALARMRRTTAST